ncbi:MAG TPA: Gldg family protein [Puia sp.]|jgi:ABC-2 type transport system permease protein|nr:Gldg family protein [Puia sp.]
MRTAFRIAKLELNTLFYSPIAWFLAVVFLFQCGLEYTDHVSYFLTVQNLGGAYLGELQFLTASLFSGQFGLYSVILSKVYLYLPLLTMGLISREVSSGTIKLLYSSPIKVREIVLGKFMAMMAYNLLLILILSLIAVTGIFNIRVADSGLLLSGLVGIYLLLCTYAAIGLFVSCLTAYQVVAAISTLVIFAILGYVGTVWQGVDFVRGLTYFLSIAGRTDHLIRGLYNTKDILYFVIITAMFLRFSIIRLQSGRETRSVVAIAARYGIVFVLALVAGYISSVPGLIGYYDATAGKTQTLAPNTQRVIKEIGNEPLVVTSYINLLDERYWRGSPEKRNEDFDRWEPYLRFKPNIQLKYVYYYDTPFDARMKLSEQYPGKSLREIAKRYTGSYQEDLADFKTPEEIRKTVDLRPEQNRYVMQLKFKDKTTFLRLFDDITVFPNEEETAAALKRLTVKLPRIVFAEGEFERGIDKAGDKDYMRLTSEITFRYALVNQGFDMDTISLNDREIPGDIAALVIADPRTNFTPAALAKIQKYIDGGGNLLIAGEPGKQNILNPLIQPLGVQMMDGLLIQKSKDFPPNMIKTYLTGAGAGLSNDLEPLWKDSSGVTMPGAAGLTYTRNGPYTIQPLLMTNPNDTWNKKGKVVLDSADIMYSAAGGDYHGSIPTALALTRNVHGREQRIVITGDADFLSTAEVKRRNTGNFLFDAELIGWFTYGQFPVDASRPDPKDIRVNLTRPAMKAMSVIYLGILPGLLLVFAAIFLIRRKRK